MKYFVIFFHVTLFDLTGRVYIGDIQFSAQKITVYEVPVRSNITRAIQTAHIKCNNRFTTARLQLVYYVER